MAPRRARGYARTVTVTTNPKGPSRVVTTEATELGTPRVYANGQTTITAPLVDPLESGTEIYCADTKATWRVVENPPGTIYALLVSGTGTATGAPLLPPPRVRLFPGFDKALGKTRSGVDAWAFGRLVISTEGVPQAYLLDPQYRLQVELLRYMPKRSRIVQQNAGRQRRNMPQGFYHPNSYVAGATPTATNGTRGGIPSNVAVDRPTEWSLAGFTQNQRLELRVADVLLPFFELANVADAVGNSINTLVHFLGNRRRKTSGVWLGGNQMVRGTFVFRYAVIDTAGNYFMTGPYSERVFARPRKWPSYPSGAYPSTRLVNLDAALDTTVAPPVPMYEQLVCSIGGIVNGRMLPP